MQGGGGLSLTDNASLLASNSSFTKNSADGLESGLLQLYQGRGGAAYMQSEANFTATNCHWEANRAGRSGGALHAGARHAVVTFSNCKLQGNVAGSTGGAIRRTKETRLIVKDSSFFSNHATELGGAVSATDSTYTNLVHVDAYNNTAGSQGGALCVSSFAEMPVVGSRVWGNTSRSCGGGAAAVLGSATLDISHSQVWNNTGRDVAGAVAIWERGQVAIIGCNLSQNAASRFGGPVHVGDTASAEVHDSIMSGNHVGRLEPCTKRLTNGSATSCGGAISARGPTFASNLQIINTTITDNTAPLGGGLCALSAAVTSTAHHDPVTVAIQGNTTLTGNHGCPGADVYASASAVLVMLPGGSNLHFSSSSFHWEVDCGMGRVLNPSKGTCTNCEAPTYMLKGNPRGNATQGRCRACPEAAECHGGAVRIAKPRFYHTHGPEGGEVPTCLLHNLTR